MKLKPSILGVLVLLGSFESLAQTTGSLSVKVRDAVTEDPVQQADVFLSTFGGGANSQHAFTDKTGAAMLGGISAGTYYLEVRAPGYIAARESIDLPAGAMQSADVLLRPENNRSASRLPGSTASADELAIPKQARKAFDDGMKNLESNPEESARQFQKAIDVYPKFARAYAMLGLAQFRLKQVEQAAESCRKAISLDPSLAMAHTVLGKVLVQQKQYSEAEPQLLEAIRLDPGSWEAPYQLARCYYSAGQLEKAMEFGRRAHDMKGAPTTAHLLMVDLYLAERDRDNAIRELEDFAKADPESPYLPAVRKKLEDLKKAQ